MDLREAGVDGRLLDVSLRNWRRLLQWILEK